MIPTPEQQKVIDIHIERLYRFKEKIFMPKDVLRLKLYTSVLLAYLEKLPKV